MNADESTKVQSNIPEVKDYIKLAIEQFAKYNGFINYSLGISYGANVGDGFMSVILKIKINGTKRQQSDDKNDNGDELTIIVKVPPENLKTRKFGTKLFEREIFVYNHVLPIFTKFQSDKGISDEECFTSFVKCYRTDYVPITMDAYIIMEDITEQGFNLYNKFKSIDLVSCEIWAKSLAKFHAISFAMRDQCPEEFNQFKNLNDPMCIVLGSIFNEPMLLDIAETPLQTLDDDEQDIIGKYIEFKKHLTLKQIEEMCNGNLSEPHSVVNHGDCWINNVLFKSHDGTSKQIRILDWQLCRYGAPALDFVYFMFACTDGNFRKNYYDRIIELYHKTLCEYLSQLGSDGNKLFPFPALLNQLKRYGKFGLIMCLFIGPMLCAETDELPSANKVAEQMVDKEKPTKSGEFFQVTAKGKSRYKERMGDIIRDMVRLEYI